MMIVLKPLIFVLVIVGFISGSSARTSGDRNKVIIREIPFSVVSDVTAYNAIAYHGVSRAEPRKYAQSLDADITIINVDAHNEEDEEKKQHSEPPKKKENDDHKKNDKENKHHETAAREPNDKIRNKQEEVEEPNRDGMMSKIVGGTFSSPTSWPWQVSIQYLGEDMYWYHSCGGTLVDSKWIVSAAHCIFKLQYCTVRVVLGDYRLSDYSKTEQVINPKTLTMHGYYNGSNNYYYDIAMVELVKDAEINEYVLPVTISTPKQDSFNNHDICYISGWGNIIGSVYEMYISDYLQQSRTTVISENECRKIYGNTIIDSQVCIMNDRSSACSGDSGSPLVCESGRTWYLVGIASWIGSDTCSPHYPNVYTRASSFEHWIRSVMEKTEY